jgi:type I restriction enzyme M protein
MVLKKKNGKEEEVQEGWVGHIMPFSLVQETYLKEELEALRKKEHRLAEILAQYEEILESLSEEEKEANTINESKDGFINAEVAKEAKELKAHMKKKVKFEQDSYEAKILSIDALIEEEKTLKKQLKVDTEDLHVKTKKTIETLEDGQVYELLELKWINPLVEALYKLSKGVIDNLTCKLQELANKYETTLQNIEDEIQKTEKALALMVEVLDGDTFDMQGLQAFKALLEGRHASN